MVPENLSSLLDHAAERFPAHGTGFFRHDRTEHFLRFPELRIRALEILSALQDLGMGKGQHLILSPATSEEIIPVLWACFYGGFVPALLQPPVSFSEYNPAAEKAARVFQILDRPYVILSHGHLKQWQKSQIPAARLIDTGNLNGTAANARIAATGPDDLALIQFSSGSTGEPKGVMLTHRNILTNTTDIIKGIALGSDDVSVNWMPLYHDMGLIGFHITPVYAGVTQFFIDPVDFVKNPFLWLDALTAKKCTITACPNFGQVLINRHLTRKPARRWDLSTIRILFNGAEPISVTTMERFLHALEPHGLDPVAMFPAYGLAEATLAVTFPDPLKMTGITAFLREPLLTAGLARPADLQDSNAIELVNLGTPLEHCEVKIVDEQNHELGEGRVGNVLVKGANVTAGYYGNPGLSAAAFRNQWLFTGDLGFIFNGALYITGRSKDIIFINGTNFYSHDLEAIALRMDDIQTGKIVISGYFDVQEGRDKLLVFIVALNNPEAHHLCLSLKNHFANHTGVIADTFVLVRSSDIPRTSSGKLQRYKLVERYLKGDLPSVITL